MRKIVETLKSLKKFMDDAGEKEIYLLLTQGSHHVPGDERSRTNPGHGYPAHDVKHLRVEVFDNETDLGDEIVKLKSKGYAYLVFAASQLTPTITHSVVFNK